MSKGMRRGCGFLFLPLLMAAVVTDSLVARAAGWGRGQLLGVFRVARPYEGSGRGGCHCHAMGRTRFLGAPGVPWQTDPFPPASPQPPAAHHHLLLLAHQQWWWPQPAPASLCVCPCRPCATCPSSPSRPARAQGCLQGRAWPCGVPLHSSWAPGAPRHGGFPSSSPHRAPESHQKIPRKELVSGP